MPARRKLLAAAAAWAAAPAFGAALQPPDWSLRAQQRLVGGPDSDFGQRARLVEEGERRLSARDAAGAEAAFDQAALMLHAADTEIGLVRTYMQQGQFRRALAFCAHTAGVHRDVVAAAALYVWLLDAGGQPAVAQQRLAEAEAQYPGEPLLAALRTQLAAPAPRAVGLLRELPARLAPYAPAPQAALQVRGGAVLLPGGAAALAAAESVGRATEVRLRNGLGDTVGARVEPLAGLDTLVHLKLTSPWPGVPEAVPTLRDPFGGRPGFVAGHVARADAHSEWPRLRMGFLGPLGQAGGPRRLGIALPGVQGAALVLDEAGRFAGLATGPQAWWPVSVLRGAGVTLEASDSGERVAPDAAYERALRLALQLLVPAG